MKIFSRAFPFFLFSIIFFVALELGCAEETRFSLDPGFSLALAQAQSSAAHRNEQDGKYAEALKEYEEVIATASQGMKVSDARGQVRTPQMYLIVGAAHLDVARIKRELVDLSSADVYQKQEADIAARLAMSERALNEALRASERNRKLPVRDRILVNHWLIEQTLGHLFLYKSDLSAARKHFQTALKLNPKSDATKWLAIIDYAEEKKSAEELANRGWRIPNWAKKVAGTKAARVGAVETIRALVNRYSPLIGSIAGTVTDELLKSAAGVRD